MIRIQQVKLPVGRDEAQLKKKAAQILRVGESEIQKLHIVRRSLDARKKPDLYFCYTVDVETQDEQNVLKRCRDKAVTAVTPTAYCFPERKRELSARPVIVGTGPAGLFCGYFLALSGCRPILLERGRDVDRRSQDVEAFWSGGELDPKSNVQFGEGGAGTFSDGKLNTLVKDKCGRNGEVLRTFVKFGAPEEILYESKPHIGTDVLKKIVKNMREEILRLGGEVKFESLVTDILIEDGAARGVEINGCEALSADIVVLAIGHSARDTFARLYERKIPMEAKPFAVGMRVEHEQSMINKSQYGAEQIQGLSPASYKVAVKTGDGRGVYSFCMCPGGYVVNASSEPGRLCVNGMSYSDRGGVRANSAVIVTVSPQDYGDGSPLSGVEFQRGLEERAYRAGGGRVPFQTYGDFKRSVAGEKNTDGKKAGTQDAEAYAGRDAHPAVKGMYVRADLTDILPRNLNEDIVEGMEQFGRLIEGFNSPDALLFGVESRTSSPVRILRDDDTLQSKVRGLYPCGEGAGYAGGITSAAMDGIRVAESIVIDGNANLQ